MKSITLKNITHTYGKHTVLHDVTLSLPIGKMIAICGPSGCGKTTLLKMINGIVKPDAGTIETGQTIRMGYFSQENEYPHSATTQPACPAK